MPEINEREGTAVIYGSSNMVEGIRRAQNHNLNQFKKSAPQYLLTAQKTSDLGELLKIVEQNGYEGTKILSWNYANMVMIMGLIALIEITVVTLTMVILGMIQRWFIKRRIIAIGMLRAQGYSCKQIKWVLFAGLTAIFMIAFCGSCLISYLLSVKFGTLIFENNRIGNLDSYISIGTLIFSMFLTYAIISITLKSYKDLSLSVMIKEVG